VESGRVLVVLDLLRLTDAVEKGLVILGEL
jgi:hypothetical protein